MKVTIVHTNNNKHLLVSTKTIDKLLQRIAKDDSRLTVTHFREYVVRLRFRFSFVLYPFFLVRVSRYNNYRSFCNICQ